MTDWVSQVRKMAGKSYLIGVKPGDVSISLTLCWGAIRG